ncbi:nuclear transport factor 2 family protein [Ilumatobacter sp.]|uniref:nuclear transport factor 2 family protein n=1 Tax=Ilumatobacter sp. TaxID=1967498 RepID=UPI003C4E1F0C
MTVIDDVLAVNDAFYAAHELRDIDAMREVWEHAARVVCVHPGWPILRGWELVEGSWAQIFAGAGRTQFILTNQSIDVGEDLAWVTLEENLVDRGETHAIAATNIFALTADGWRMIAHQGSPVMAVLG